MFKDVNAVNPKMKMFGPDGVAESPFAEQGMPGALQKLTYITNPTLDPKLYPPAAQDFFKTFKQKFGKDPEPYAIYGYEAMKVALLAIQNAGDKGNDKQAVIDAFFKIKDRDSVLGKYSIDRTATRRCRITALTRSRAASSSSTRSSRRRPPSDQDRGTQAGRPNPGRPARFPSRELHGSSHPSRARLGQAPPQPGQAASDNILWILLAAALVRTSWRRLHQTLDDVKTGLSNGTIWALIALGYTLVYGIIELINFAHGEVFMIGSFVSVSIWQTLGVTGDSGSARSSCRSCWGWPWR